MEYIRNRKSNVPFSLHDSRIIQIEINSDTLTLKMDRIFQYVNNEETWFSGTIEFSKTDIEECRIMVFNAPYGYEGEKSFSGNTMSLEEFNEQYHNAEFEIITEAYCGYDTIYEGWIWQENEDPIVGIIIIWNTGDMIYRV